MRRGGFGLCGAGRRKAKRRDGGWVSVVRGEGCRSVVGPRRGKVHLGGAGLCGVAWAERVGLGLGERVSFGMGGRLE